ncbi:hypothetical protein CEXT_642271 [Caerostris extrusa]|uniref:Uncharacterized protein n=1 Tax=Caerostris extrusa TaxID=172846 RepID=A0AAV4WEK1_CAEEX|nr:hypothetical protein CEXT_642271 [Caerostris extrusa]
MRNPPFLHGAVATLIETAYLRTPFSHCLRYFLKILKRKYKQVTNYQKKKKNTTPPPLGARGSRHPRLVGGVQTGLCSFAYHSRHLMMTLPRLPCL